MVTVIMLRFRRVSTSNLASKLTQAVTFLTYILEAPDSNLILTLSIMTGIFRFFLISSRQMSVQCLKLGHLGHDRFLVHAFQFILHCS
jgi:hypothetical protein